MKPTGSGILTINVGSSSLKFALFEADGSLHRLLDGKIDRIGLNGGNFSVRDATGKLQESLDLDVKDHRFAAALGGLDTLVFSGGIGENAPRVRTRVCDGLGFLGLELDEKQNTANAAVISRSDSRVSVRVIHADEELMIAGIVARYLQKPSRQTGAAA